MNQRDRLSLFAAAAISKLASNGEDNQWYSDVKSAFDLAEFMVAEEEERWRSCVGVDGDD